MTDPARVLLVGVVVLYGSLLAVLGVAALRRLRHSEHSAWYFAGAASAWLSFALRNPVAGVVSAIVAVIVFMAAGSLSLGDAEDDSNPPPEIAPIYAATLRMPTDYPFTRRRLDWPAFFGHRFCLGGDRA